MLTDLNKATTCGTEIRVIGVSSRSLGFHKKLRLRSFLRKQVHHLSSAPIRKVAIRAHAILRGRNAVLHAAYASGMGGAHKAVGIVQKLTVALVSEAG